MSRLRRREVAAFSSGLEILYSAADMPSLSRRVTRCLKHLFSCEISSFDLIDLTAVRWNTVVISPALPDWAGAVEVLQQHAHEHPIVTHAARHNYQHAIRTSDLISLRQYRHLGIYHDFFRPHLLQVNRQLGFVIRPSTALTLGVSVNRQGRDFTTEDRFLLELLRPHLLQAYEVAQLQARTSKDYEIAAAVAGGGLCQVDATGKCEWTTAEVERLFALYFPLEHRRGDRLPPSVLAVITHHAPERDPDTANLLARPRTWRFPRVHGTLSVRVAARVAAGGWQLFITEDRPEISVKDLAARYDLTKREAETLYWISQGKTNEESGLILGVATRTVEKYVERLFEKLGINNRTAAARMAMEV